MDPTFSVTISDYNDVSRGIIMDTWTHYSDLMYNLSAVEYLTLSPGRVIEISQFVCSVSGNTFTTATFSGDYV
jgi:hypothetical protein